MGGGLYRKYHWAVNLVFGAAFIKLISLTLDFFHLSRLARRRIMCDGGYGTKLTTKNPEKSKRQEGRKTSKEAETKRSKKVAIKKTRKK